MTRVFVKVCGLTTMEAAETCAELGVDAVGFVFADSPRRVTPRQARAMAEVLPESTSRVAVFRHLLPDVIDVVVDELRPHVIQADHDSLSEIGDVELLPVYREGGVPPPLGVRYLYEGRESGRGRSVDWLAAARLAVEGEMILAGGLSPETVTQAIAVVRPFGVDVSSGVEMAPGRKSPERIRSFVAAVRDAEERMAR